MTTDLTTVHCDDAGNGVCMITLNRPDSLNAMNRQLIDEVPLAFDAANVVKVGDDPLIGRDEGSRQDGCTAN